MDTKSSFLKARQIRAAAKSQLPATDSPPPRPPSESGLTPEETAAQEADANVLYPPPRLTWARPLMQGYKGRINQYVRDEVVEEVGRTLREVGRQWAIDRFKEGPFGHFLQLRLGYSANNALHELMAHEVEDGTLSDKDRWFHIGGKDIAFTALDYTLVTGLVFTKQNFDPFVRKHNISQMSMFRRVFKGKRTKIETLRERFSNLALGDILDDYLKAANIICLYHLLICGGNVWIADWVWALVEDTDRWATFPWGAFSYQILCHNMRTLYKHPDFFSGDTYHFFGPIWALQIWSYEVIPELGTSCGSRDDEMRFPRCLMWETHKSTCELISLSDPSVQVEPLVVTSTEECNHYYKKFLDWHRQEPEVLYVPSKRNAWKKLPYQKQMEMFSKKKKNKKAGPACARTKRKRQESENEHEARTSSGDGRTTATTPAKESGMDTYPAVNCCLHGLPCRSSKVDDDAHFARLAKRIAPHMPVDTSETGWIAVLAQKLVQMTSGRRNVSGDCSSSRSIPATTPSHEGPANEIAHPMNELVHRSHSTVGIDHHDPDEQASDNPANDVFQMLYEYAPLGRRDMHHSTNDENGHTYIRGSSDHQGTSEHGVTMLVNEVVAKRFESGEQGNLHVEQPSEGAVDHGNKCLAFDHHEPSKPKVLNRCNNGVQNLLDCEETAVTDAEHGGDSFQSNDVSDNMTSSASTNGSIEPGCIRKRFQDFRESTADLAPPLISNGQRLPQEFFMSIEDCTSEFSEEVINLYLSYKRERLNNRTNICVEDVSFYKTLLLEFDNYHGPNSHTRSICGRNLYKKWSCPQAIIDIAKKWKVNGQVVMVCNVDKSHWVTVRVLLKEWTVEMYDDKAFTLSEKELNARKARLKPVTRLLPRLIFWTDYWKQNKSSPEKVYEMDLRVMGQSQTLCQVDSVSSGAFACMHVDSILNPEWSRRKSVDAKLLADYRRQVACKIFSLTVY